MTARAGDHLPLGLVVAGQLLICLLVKATGFSAISDDDYARVVIAQQFVLSPSWDPSGTSWLPFPFLSLGSVMSLAGASLVVARSYAIFTSLLSACLLYAAGLNLGASRRGAALSALLAAAVPYSARLSVATVPEYLTAALIAFAASTLAHAETSSPPGQRALLGSSAIFIACASRYEAWPAALAFAFVQIQVALRGKRGKAPWLASALVLSFPGAWLIHGVLHHESALFFVKRVVDYKQALDANTSSSLAAAFAYPHALIFAEPELAGASVFALGVLAFRRSTVGAISWRPWLVPAAVLVALLASALRSGAPTHHAERALLSIWLLAALYLGLFFEKSPDRSWAIRPIAAGALLGGAFRLLGVFELEPFVDRSREIAFAREALAETPSHIPIALSLPDYGYFALMAAAGKPSRFVVVERHDPRERAPDEEPWADFVRGGGCLYVTERKRPPHGDSVVKASSGFELRRFDACGTP